MTTKYRRTYTLLKGYGFSAAKALEIIFDAKRGDTHAWHYIRCARHHLSHY